MIKRVLSIMFSLLLMSCGSSKKIASTTKRSSSSSSGDNISLADKIVWTAVSYKGVPYKYAGTTKRGMDCSGLLYTSFKTRGVALPRTSYLMYNTGFPIRLGEVKRGDLVFFKTTKKSRNKVNHVGLVTSVDNGIVKFIHSTTSKGVIVTPLSSNYWKNSFVAAKRVL